MLTHVQHCEAVSLLRRVLDEAGPILVSGVRIAVEGWLEENRPPPEAYSDSMRHLAGQPTDHAFATIERGSVEREGWSRPLQVKIAIADDDTAEIHFREPEPPTGREAGAPR